MTSTFSIDDDHSCTSAVNTLIAQGKTEELQTLLEREAKTGIDGSEFYSFMSKCIVFCPAEDALVCARLILAHAPKHFSWFSTLEEAIQDNNLGVAQAICEFGNRRQEDLQYRSLIKYARVNRTSDDMLRLLVSMAQDTNYKDVSLILLGTENHQSLFSEFWPSLDDETKRVVMINLMVRDFVAPEILEIAYDHNLVERIVAEDDADRTGTPLIDQHPYMKALHLRHTLTRTLDGAGASKKRALKL